MLQPQWILKDLDYSAKAVQESDAQQVILRLSSVFTGGTIVQYAPNYFDPDSLPKGKRITGISLNQGVNTAGTQPFTYQNTVTNATLTMYDISQRVVIYNLPLAELSTQPYAGGTASNEGKTRIFDFIPNMKMSYVTLNSVLVAPANSVFLFTFHFRK